MATTYDLSPRDVALYQRSNEYLSRLNDLDPYSQEYVNVYNDYVDTIDQLSNRDFRASLGTTLLEFAPLTRPRVRPRAPEPVQLAPADNILYRNRPISQQEVSSPVAISPSNTSPLAIYALGQNMSSGSPNDIPDEIKSMYQNSMDTLRTNPEPVQLAPTDNILYRRWGEFDPVPITPEITLPHELKSPPIKLSKLYESNAKKLRKAPEPVQEVTPDVPVEPQSRDKNYALSFINTTDGPFGPVVPLLQAARTYAQRDSSQRDSSKEQAKAPTRWRPVYFGLDATGRTPSYAQALADISWDVWDGGI